MGHVRDWTVGLALQLTAKLVSFKPRDFSVDKHPGCLLVVTTLTSYISFRGMRRILRPRNSLLAIFSTQDPVEAAIGVGVLRQYRNEAQARVH